MSDTQVADPAAEELEQPTPEEALAGVREQLAAAEARADQERAARTAAEQRAAQASQATQGAHETTLEARLQSETSRRDSAKARYRAAREAGDIEAEIAANEELSAAVQMVQALTIERGRIAAQKAAPRPEPQNAGNIPGPAASRWLAEHPKISTDASYYAACQSAHEAALRDGCAVESPAYFNHINARLEQQFGPDHGKEGSVQTRPAAPAAQPARQNGARASSVATPPSRGAPQSQARNGVNMAQIAARLGVTEQDCLEAADICNMKPEVWAAKQAEILAQRGPQSAIHGADQVYR
jgi:hypothetical protein